LEHQIRTGWTNAILHPIFGFYVFLIKGCLVLTIQFFAMMAIIAANDAKDGLPVSDDRASSAKAVEGGFWPSDKPA